MVFFLRPAHVRKSRAGVVEIRSVGPAKASIAGWRRGEVGSGACIGEGTHGLVPLAG